MVVCYDNATYLCARPLMQHLAKRDVNIVSIKILIEKTMLLRYAHTYK